MGLITQGPAFARWSDNLGAASATVYGVTVTAGANSADGTAVTLLDDLTHDCEYLVIAIAGGGGSGVNSSMLLDILVDPAGGTSWSEAISNLLVGYAYPTAGASGNQGIPRMYHFPIWLPAGTAIGALARTEHSSTIAPQVVVYAAGGNRNPASWWCGQKVETVGTFDVDNSLGQAHTPGNTGTFSSWTSLGAATAARAGALQYGAQGVGSGSMNSLGYQFEFGAGSNKIGPAKRLFTGGLEAATHFFPGPVFCDIPAATQMQVRGTCSGTAQVIDVAAYLVQ